MTREATSTAGAAATSAAAVGGTGVSSASPVTWWGRWELADGEAGLWRIGPLELAVERQPERWRVAWVRHDADEPRPDPPFRVPVPASRLPPLPEGARYVTPDGAPTLRLEPALPDRALVAYPASAVHVLGGESVTLHVAVPLAVRVVAGERPLVEVAGERMRETWLGHSTVSGEICWAAPLPARLRRDLVVIGDHLAIVQVTLVNRAAATLLVERVSLPAVNLRLWWDGREGLLGDDVTVERDRDGDLASVRIDAPRREGLLLVAPARQPEPRLGLVRALEALLG